MESHFILASSSFDYPLHIGLTESGTILGGNIRSSYAIGTLLKDNIGDTIRVSLTSDPLDEIFVAKEIFIENGFLEAENTDSDSSIYRCENCGAVVVLSSHEVATFCPYCNTSHIVKTATYE